MVSIPVRLFKAARRERIRFHRVYRPAAAEPPEPPEPEWEEPEPLPPPPPRNSIRQMPRTASPPPAAHPSAPPEPEPVARVRNLAVGEVTDQPVEEPQILKGYEI